MESSLKMIGGRYILEQRLGQGGMGAVYRATDRLTQEVVALKRVMVSPSQLDFASKVSVTNSHDLRLALAQEFKMLASLRHPHIISVLDYGFDDQQQPFLTMELLENPATLVAAGRDLPRPRQVELLVQLLQALAYLHRRGIIHRDLKPDNVLVINGQVKVLDFGLAMVHQPLAEDSDHIAGTVAYMAPEVLEGDPATQAADMYAVGVIAYELFAGRHPFDINDPGGLIWDVLTAEPDIESLALSDGLKNILERLLVKVPEARYSNASEVINLYAGAIHRPELLVETRAIRESFLQAAQFVGREAEVEQLVGALASAKAGQGSAWLVGGESGVGKSRLLDEIRTQALVQGALVLQGQAVSEGAAAYQVWREVFRRLCLEIDLSDLEAGVLKVLVPDIDRLLGREIPDPPPVAPPVAYQRLLDVITATLQRQAQCLVILLEDLHWASDESIAILEHLARHLEGTLLLIVASYRSEERPNLPELLPGLHRLALSRLGVDSIAALSESMLGEAGRQPELVKLLQHETEGNTFFIVEVVRTLAEEAGQLDRVGEMTLPPSVFAGGMRAVVARRLQRAPEAAHPLLQIAAVAGRRLDLDLLRAIEPATPIEQWLDSCAEASVLEVQEGRWRFAHDKLREGLLLDLPAPQRKNLHRRVAEALEGLYAADLSPFYPGLAHHWSQVIADGEADSPLVIKTLDYWRLAGQQAAERSANSEALAHFNTALDLLPHLPAGSERDQQELILQLPRAGIFRSVKGIAAPETGQAYIRTRELCRRLGKTAQLAPVLNGLYAYYLNGAVFTPARQTLEELLSLPQAQNDPTYQMIGHRGLGAVMLHTGQLIAAREHLQKSLALYDPALHGNHAVLYGIDPKEKASSYLALTLWMLGYPDQAIALERAAVAHVEGLNHSHSLAQGLTYLCILYILAQAYELVLAPAQRLLALSEEHSFPLLAAVAHIFIGDALVHGGQIEPGIAQIRRGLADCLRTGTQNNRSHFQTLLAEACGKGGLYDEGLALLEETEAWVKTSGEHWADAELYRVRGELLIASTGIDNPGAEIAFQQGIEVARSQQARMWELRVATGLAGLWQKQGQPRKGLALLQPIYASFTEGFETPDLKAARHLLDQLTATV